MTDCPNLTGDGKQYLVNTSLCAGDVSDME